jgi:acetyl esterase/lipase
VSEFESATVPGEGRRPLEVDVFRPAVPPNGVAVIVLHGGGWAQGHRAMVHGYAKSLAARGFVALAAEYRLLPEAPWPAQLDDVRDVVRWTKANASALAIDPAKVALQGFSAGAHLALLVGGTQPGSGNEHRLGASAGGTEVAAIVSFFAPAKLDANPAALSQPPFSLLLNGGGIEAARAASPIYYVHRSFPSTFILGGMADYMQPLKSGLGLLQAFVDVGAEVEFHYLHSQTHEFSSTSGMLSEVMAEVAFFYRRTLLKREALAEEARTQNIFARASNPQEFVRLVGG